MVATIIHNNTFIQIIEYTNLERQQLELSFTKQVANWNFIKKNYEHSGWDGNVEFIDKYMRIPIGLYRRLELICKRFNMELTWDNLDGVIDGDFDDELFTDWVKESFKDAEKKPRDYQVDAALKTMKFMKSRSEIATSAGKTLIIFMVYQHLKNIGKLKDHKMLIVVPKISLIIQTQEEFIDYAESIGATPPKIQMMHGGKSKEREDVDLILGTFQTLTNLDEEFFNDVNVLCVDEAHYTTALSIRKIIQKAIHTEYRFGLSGTLKNDDSANSFTLDAYLGPEINNISARFLIDNDYAVEIGVKLFVLRYIGYNVNEKFQQLRCSDMAKHGSKLLALEKSYVVENQKRFDFVVGLISKTTKNTLVLFSDIKYGYGKRLFTWLIEHARDKVVMYMDGSTPTKQRLKDKKTLEEGVNKILVASYGVFSTGESVNNIHNIFLTESYKSDRIIKQSLGRGMRNMKGKEFVNIIDFVDDLSVPGKRKGSNYLLRHGIERVKIYDDEGHKIQKFNVNLRNPANGQSLF